MTKTRRLIKFLISLVLSVTAAAAGAEERPNIVLIVSDDQAWTDYSFMGHPYIQTPHLDALAGQSAVFRRGYVPTALCRASLLTLISGRYAYQHGVTGNDPSPKYAPPGTPLADQLRMQLISRIDGLATIPKQLVQTGYLCHQSGKWWEGNFSSGGFTHGMTRGFPEEGGRHGDDGLTIGRQGLQAVTDFMDMAIEKQQPFFIWYAPILPHTPHNPPPRLLSRFSEEKDLAPSVARYYAMCQWFDETCGQLLEYLDAKQIRDNTLIVYICDNGWIQDPQGNRYAARSKQTPYEGGVRTPILFSWPATILPADRPELCSSLDVMPTILAAGGAPIPPDLPGRNLLPELQSGQPLPARRLFGEAFAHDIPDIDNPEASLLFRWCIQGKWKLILTYDGEVNRYQTTHPRTDPRPQLYDLLADPGETTNLAAEQPQILAELVQHIDDWYPVRERRVQTEYK